MNIAKWAFKFTAMCKAFATGFAVPPFWKAYVNLEQMTLTKDAINNEGAPENDAICSTENKSSCIADIPFAKVHKNISKQKWQDAQCLILQFAGPHILGCWQP